MGNKATGKANAGAFPKGKSGNPKTQWQKGVSANPAGRPKKIFTVLKAQGYNKTDIITAFQEMAWYTVADLEKVFKDDKKPVIMRITANALNKALNAGNFERIREVLEYALGRPTQRTEIGGIPEGLPVSLEVAHEANIDYDKLPDEVLRAIAAARVTKKRT